MQSDYQEPCCRRRQGFDDVGEWKARDFSEGQLVRSIEIDSGVRFLRVRVAVGRWATNPCASRAFHALRGPLDVVSEAVSL